MQCKDLPAFRTSWEICRGLSLEDELNDADILRSIRKDTFSLLGISPQPLNLDILAEKSGEVIVRYAGSRKIDSAKVTALIAQHTATEACKILGRTAICLMCEYQLMSGIVLA